MELTGNMILLAGKPDLHGKVLTQKDRRELCVIVSSCNKKTTLDDVLV